jgi:hypothetical protein
MPKPAKAELKSIVQRSILPLHLIIFGNFYFFIEIDEL